jgi:hypothetical protein
MGCETIVFKPDGLYFKTFFTCNLKSPVEIGWLKVPCELGVNRPFKLSYDMLKNALPDKCTNIQFDLIEPIADLTGEISGETILNVTCTVDGKEVLTQYAPSFHKTDTPVEGTTAIDSANFFSAVQLAAESTADLDHDSSGTLRHVAVDKQNVVATDAVGINIQQNITIPELERPFVLARQFFVMFPKTGTCQLGIWHEIENDKPENEKPENEKSETKSDNLYINFTYNKIPVQIFANSVSQRYPKWRLIVEGHENLRLLFTISKRDAIAIRNNFNKFPLKNMKSVNDRFYVALSSYEGKLCVESYIPKPYNYDYAQPKDDTLGNTRLICSSQSTCEQEVIDHELLVIVSVTHFKSLLSNEDVKISAEFETDKKQNDTDSAEVVSAVELYDTYLDFSADNSIGAMIALTITTKNMETKIRNTKDNSTKIAERTDYNNAFPVTTTVDLALNLIPEKASKPKARETTGLFANIG